MSGLLPALLLLLAAPAAGKGALQIVSQPGVEVEWEGILLGETDARGLLTIRDIPPGDYRIALRKQGFRPMSRRLTVEPGESTVSLRLEALPPPPPRRPPRKEPAPAPKAASPAAAERPRAEDEAPAPSPEPAAPAAFEAPEGADAPDESTPHEATAGAPAPASAGRPWTAVLAFLVMSAALVAAAGFAVRRGRGHRRKKGVKRRESSSSKRGASGHKRPARAGAGAETPEFLKDLQRREERVAAATRYRDGREVIEITEVEVLDAETDGVDADEDGAEELEH